MHFLKGLSPRTVGIGAAVITVAKEINVPRLPSLRGITRSKSAAIATWGLQELGAGKDMVGLAGSSTQVIKVFFPRRVCLPLNTPAFTGRTSR